MIAADFKAGAVAQPGPEPRRGPAGRARRDPENQSRPPDAFSLVEVAFATGIFAVSIVAMLGLLVPVTQAVTATADATAASTVADLVKSELTRKGFTAVAAQLATAAQVQSRDNDPGYNPATDPQVLFASRGGDKIGDGGSAVWNGQDGEKFFEIILIRNDTLSPAANDSTAGFLAFTLRVRWPAFLPNGLPVAGNTRKDSLLFNAALLR